VQRETVERVGERREFPGADVAGEVDDAFAAAVAGEKIFVAVKDENIVNIFCGVAGEAGELGGHPAEVADHLADRGFALGVGPLWKCQAEVAVGDFAQFGDQREEQSGDDGGERAGENTRQDAKKF
jgi:hypothetical protein